MRMLYIGRPEQRRSDESLMYGVVCITLSISYTVFVSIGAIKCLERLVSEITCYV